MNMKKIVFLLLATCTIFAVNAQSEKYVKAMEQKLGGLDTIRTVATWQELANSFERIADAEKTQWLPYYYAAYSHTMAGYMISRMQPEGGFADKTDPEADKADALIVKAQALTKENSEIFCLKKMVATLHMMGDPMNRYQTYGAQATEALEKAKQLNPENPRVYLLEGQDKLYTPEQFGGSKAEAKVLFEQAQKKYEAFKPESNIHPQWGKQMVGYFIGEASK
jgi:hypothetical protein